MKKYRLISLILIFSLVVLNNTYPQINQDWKWVHPTPQGNTLRHVQVLSATNWVAIGYAGTFLSTSNSGTSWNVYTNAGGTTSGSGLGKTLYNGWFMNLTTGFVCGASGWIGRTTNGGANWDSLASATASTLYGMRFINSTTGFVCGSSGVVLKTINAGTNWTLLTTGSTSTLYNIYPLDVNNIYVNTNSNNVLVSTNGGTNWSIYATGGSTLYDINFGNTSTGFVCGSSGSVRVTTNGGVNWVARTTPSTSSLYEMWTASTVVNPFDQGFEGTTFPPTGWRAVNVLGTVVWTRSTMYAHSGVASAFINYDCGTGGGLDWLITPQIAINSGDSLVFWLRTYDSGFPPDSLAVRVSTTDTALASFTNRILYLADGNGYPGPGIWGRFAVSLNAFANQMIYIAFKHGNDCGDGIFIDDVHIGPASPFPVFTVYAAGDPNNIYKSANLGLNWTAISHLDPSQAWTSTYYTLDVNGNTMMACGANGLINVSTNAGTNWTTKTRWLSAGYMYDVWCEYGSGKAWAVGAPGISGTTYDQILYSSNGGVSWVNQNIGNSNATYRSISMVNATTGYICGTSGVVRKTTNGGTTWDSLAAPIPSTLTLYKVDFVNASTGWVFSNTTNAGGTIWKTTNGGGSWIQQDMGGIGSNQRIYGADMLDANTGWLVNYYPYPYHTTNGGTNWIQDSLIVSTAYLYDIKMINSSSGYACGTSGRLYRTTNGGATKWDTVSTPYSSSLYATDWVNMSNGFIVGSSGYTAKTTNGGVSWSLNNTSGSIAYGVYMRSADTAYTVGGSGGHIFKWQKQPTGIITWQNEVPTKFFLSQNYPNPFNPVTTIKFGIPRAGSVSLKVYDITGRLVSLLFNDVPLNAGVVKYEFDGKSLASGVYFYSLFVDGNRIDSKKMVLVK